MTFGTTNQMDINKIKVLEFTLNRIKKHLKHIANCLIYMAVRAL